MTSTAVAKPLAGKVALVTGSTSGIGLAIARRAASEGADVVLHGIDDPSAVDPLVKELSKLSGTTTRYVRADISDPVEIRQLIDQIARESGRIDILVNCAGVQHVAPLEEFPPQAWDAVLAVNLSGPFHATRLTLPLMRRQGWGRIINIASVSALVSAPYKAAYTAAKHGLLGLTKVVALETAATPITCNAICPGWVLTPLVERQIQHRMVTDGVDRDEATRRLLKKQPSGQFVSVQHVAGLAFYLMSDDAAQVRGAAMTIDGGYTIA